MFRSLGFRISGLVRSQQLTKTRHFGISVSRLIVNPLLPFDVLEELDDETIEQNEELKKQKKKLIRQKKIITKKLVDAKAQKGDGDEKGLSTVVKETGVISAETTLAHPTTSELGIPSAGGKGGLGGDNGGNDKPPSNCEEDDPKKKDKEMEEENHNKKEEKEIEEEIDAEEGEDPEQRQTPFRDALNRFGRFLFKCLETIGITLSSLGVLGLSGLLYHKFYNSHVLKKMDEAFQNGDPAYQLAMHKKTNKNSLDECKPADFDDEDDILDDLAQYWVERPQQKLLDDIISGKIRGRYFLAVGEKGTGKTTLIMEAMKKIDGKNVAIFDAHADPEIFRIRLGRALNFAYNEDYIGSLFSIRGPRDTTALLDIERAFNKLELLAISRRMSGRSESPMVLIINNSHLIKENEEGIKLLELLQQKAESLSASELVTIVFNSDDYWVYEKLKRLGTRLELINVKDFNRKETVNVLQFIRGKFYPPTKYPNQQLLEDTCHRIYDLIGGRPQHISQVSRHKDVIKACHEIIDREKTWFLNQCGLLGEEMDDDVMEFGKFALSAMLLMHEFVIMDRQRMNTLISKDEPDIKDLYKDHQLPELPLWRSRQIMTRPDYIQQYDNLNIFTVDSDSRVRADSVPMMRAFHEIASQPHFDELLEDTVQRVAAIESLNRTRELVMKDLVLGDLYNVERKDQRFVIGMTKRDEEDGAQGHELYMEEINKNDHRKKWWKKRMGRFESYLPPASGDGQSKN